MYIPSLQADLVYLGRLVLCLVRLLAAAAATATATAAAAALYTYLPFLTLGRSI
jgi:hypothetical protein